MSRDPEVAAYQYPPQKRKAGYSERQSLERPPRGNQCACLVALATVAFLMVGPGCAQENQNPLGRRVKNWTGTNGVLDIYAGANLVMRFVPIDKLSTAYGVSDSERRPYRYGYGHVNRNLNFVVDPGRREVYFEVSDCLTNTCSTKTTNIGPRSGIRRSART